MFADFRVEFFCNTDFMYLIWCLFLKKNMTRTFHNMFVIGTMQIYYIYVAAILELHHQFGTKWSNNMRIELVAQTIHKDT